MRALLVVNHKATTTSGRVRDVLVQALRSEVELTVEHTRDRGHAAQLARDAVAHQFDVVVALGGDGTVNEVVNGLLTGQTAGERPALAVVPGGSTNVFARALGLPRDWVEATGVLLEALRAGRSRTIGLGRADDRYFTFCAGVGLDAEVIHRVEQARRRGIAPTPRLYLRTLAARYAAAGRHRAKITLERADAPDDSDLALLIVQNTSPWTYLGARPLDACPRASFELGLDLLGMRALGVPSTARVMFRLLFPGPDNDQRTNDHGVRVSDGDQRALRLHDVTEFTVRSSTPLAFQLDGDYLGERDKVHFVAVPAALRVIC